MSLDLRKVSDPSEGIRDILKRECRKAVGFFDEYDDRHELVHEVRKSLKKLRAVLRLVRDDVDFYKKENIFFRDEGRKISDTRDRTSLLETLDLLYEQFGDRLYKNSFSTIRTKLESKRSEMAEEIALENTLENIRERLEAKLKDIDSWPIKARGFKTFRKGVRRVYKRGRKRGFKAMRKRSPALFHEWRKRVKYLRYQLRVLSPIWPEILDTWEDELHRLSDYLGADRDLFLLSKEMDILAEEGHNEKEIHLVQSLIQGQRDELQKHAILLGRKLYALKTSDFLELIEASWKSFAENAAIDVVSDGELEY